MYLPTTKGKLRSEGYIKIFTSLFIFSILSFFIMFFPKFVKDTYGIEPTEPLIDYQSFRPNPAEPFFEKIEDYSLLCGNDMIIIKKFKVTPNEGICSQNGNTLTCSYVIEEKVGVSVDASKSRLPIMGNTQLVYNQENSVLNNEELDDTIKVNNLVSWYLNGAVNYAENPHPISDFGSLINEWWTGYYANAVNFSGPLRKLLPQDIQFLNKIEQIENATGSNKETEYERYDQIVGCTYGIPTPLMLVEVIINKFLSIFNKKIDIPASSLGNFIGPCNISPAFEAFKEELRLSDWSKTVNLLGENKLPPIYGSDRYPNPRDWWIAYERWRGNTCIVTPSWKIIPAPLRNFGFCVENILKPNYYADLFMNIPMSSTEDRVGKVKSVEPVPNNTNDVKAEILEYIPSYANLFFPHMQESLGLSEQLQTTFKPQEGTDNKYGYTEPVDISSSCQILQVRTNEEQDDFLWGGESLAIFKYKAEFECTFEKESVQVCANQICNTVQKYTPDPCEKKLTFTANVFTYTPLAGKVWSRLVAGNSAVARRMFPKTGTDTFGSFIDMPTVTTAEYKVKMGDVTVQPAIAEIYFSHIGGISEYFLKGIQTLLRPEGYGEDITFSDAAPSSNIIGGEDINCDQDISDIAVSGLNKSEGKRVSDIWYGAGVGKAYFEECNNDVIQRANAKGVNPIFALAIWIHESAASNYEAKTPVEDFGIHGSSSAPPNNFSAQLDAFLNLPDFYSSKCGVKSLDTFISMYWFGHCTPQNQTEKDKLYQYIDELNFIYSVIAPGVSLPNYPK